MAAPLCSRPESGREGIRRTTRHALRQSVPLSSIRTVTVGFGFAPNLLTLPNLAGARGLRRSLAITAGGDFHPALRTSAGQPPGHRYYGHSGTTRAMVLTRLNCRRMGAGTRLRYKPDAGGTPAVQPERIDDGNARGGGSQGGAALVDRDGAARRTESRRGAGRDKG